MTTRRSGLGRGLDALIPVHSEPDRLDFAEVRVDPAVIEAYIGGAS